MDLQRVGLIALCGWIIGLTTVDFHFDHFVLQGDKSKLEAVCSYYNTLELQPVPFNLVLPVVFLLGFVLLTRVVLKYRTTCDFLTLASMVASAAVFAGVVLPARLALTTETTDRALQWSLVHKIAVGHLVNAGTAIISIVLQFQAPPSKPRSKKE